MLQLINWKLESKWPIDRSLEKGGKYQRYQNDDVKVRVLLILTISKIQVVTLQFHRLLLQIDIDVELCAVQAIYPNVFD